MIESSARLLGLACSLARSMRHSTAILPIVKSPSAVKEETGVHCIQDRPQTPFMLFKKWYQEHANENHIVSNALTLSTASKDGRVSSRNLILRRLDDDGFVIMTDRRSRKSQDLAENPHCAMSFLWLTERDGLILSRQVRIEGRADSLVPADFQELYDSEPLFCKLRAHVCHQGQRVDWEALKGHHDQLLAEVQERGNQLSRPEHVVAYKVVPNVMEFYESFGSRIADRLMFLKARSDEWDISRLAA